MVRIFYSSGVDEFNPSVAKFATNAVLALVTIINCSINTGTVSDALKIFKVIPLYKSGNKEPQY